MNDTRLALSDIRGLLNDLLEKLSGANAREWHNALKRFLRKENPWGDVLPDLDWANAYKFLLGEKEWKKREGELNKLLASSHDDTHWLIPVLRGVTCNKVVEALRKLEVAVWTYATDLDKGVPTNDRSAKKASYCVQVKRRVEADEELKNLSADDLTEQKITGITLLERLLLELAYFMSTGQHLDVENWTLCSGSRHSDGRVPYVDWRSVAREIGVDWFPPDGRRDELRARAAVSL